MELKRPRHRGDSSDSDSSSSSEIKRKTKKRRVKELESCKHQIALFCFSHALFVEQKRFNCNLADNEQESAVEEQKVRKAPPPFFQYL